VLIVDNASADGTCAAIADATRGWTVRVRVVQAGANIGFAAANNRAVLQLAGCDLIALLNPDAFPEPGWLAALLAAADRHPEAGSFASRLMLDGQPGRLDGVGDVCHVSGLVWRHAHGRDERQVPESHRSAPVFSACAAAALYRRRDWIEVGGLDERFFCYVEDVDLGFRLQLAGRRCWYVPDAVVHHLGSASAGVGSAFAVYHGHRNLEWLFVKNMPGHLLWRYLPLHLSTWPLLLIWFGIRGRGGSFARAKWDALRGLPEAWRSRRTVQRSRVRTPAEINASLDHGSLWRRLRSGG
jgi:GT2 family glycosyltransferase